MAIERQLLLGAILALGLAYISVFWLYRQLGRPSRESQQIEVLRAQLADEMARNDKLATRSDRMLERIEALEAEQELILVAHEADREEAANLRAEVAELRHGIKLLITQLKKADLSPEWHPPEPSARRKRPASGTSMASRIAAQFNIDEINSLAFDVGIDPESFTGATVDTRARELVKFVARRGKLTMLEQRIEEIRPAPRE